MAENCIGPTCEYSGETVAVEGEPRVPDGVDPTVEAMQATRGDLPVDAALGVAQGAQQLADGHDPVLACRDLA
jgi:hypothetical protein